MEEKNILFKCFQRVGKNNNNGKHSLSIFPSAASRFCKDRGNCMPCLDYKEYTILQDNLNIAFFVGTGQFYFVISGNSS